MYNYGDFSTLSWENNKKFLPYAGIEIFFIFNSHPFPCRIFVNYRLPHYSYRTTKTSELIYYQDKHIMKKMLFGCLPRAKIDTLRPPLLIYVSKTGIEISSYGWFYKTKFTVKWKKWELNSDIYMISSILIHNKLGWCSFHRKVNKLNEQQFFIIIYIFSNDTFVAGIKILRWKTIFKS